MYLYGVFVWGLEAWLSNGLRRFRGNARPLRTKTVFAVASIIILRIYILMMKTQGIIGLCSTLCSNLNFQYLKTIIIIIMDSCIALMSVTQWHSWRLTIITPALALLPLGAWTLQGITSCRVPIYYTWSRETIVDKMPCLRAYAPSGIRTHDPLITSREHEPLHHSAPIFQSVRWCGLLSHTSLTCNQYSFLSLFTPTFSVILCRSQNRNESSRQEATSSPTLQYRHLSTSAAAWAHEPFPVFGEAK